MSNTSKNIQTLTDQVEKLSARIGKKQKCFPIMTILGVAAPFLAALVLYLINPSFIQKQEGGRYVRDSKKMAVWTGVFTIVIWFFMFLYTYCTGYKATKACVD